MSKIDPTHYSNGGLVETIDVINDLGWGKDFCRGNVLKYMTRYRERDGVDGLRKAKRYLEFLIAIEEGKSPSEAPPWSVSG